MQIIPLKYISEFRCRHSYKFYKEVCNKFEIGKLESQIFVSLDDLRKWLKLKSGSYKNFADIRRKILEPVMADINGDKCNIIIDYEEKKEGRKIIGIELYLKLRKF